MRGAVRIVHNDTDAEHKGSNNAEHTRGQTMLTHKGSNNADTQGVKQC